MIPELILSVSRGLHAAIASSPTFSMQPMSGQSESSFWISFLFLSAGILAPVYYTVVREFVESVYPFKYKIVKIKDAED